MLFIEMCLYQSPVGIPIFSLVNNKLLYDYKYTNFYYNINVVP